MKAEDAKKQAHPFMDKAPNGKPTETLCVIEDMGVFVNNDITEMKKIAVGQNKEIFVFKGEKSAPKKVVEDSFKKKKKKK
jgi:hypothetical protein